MSSRDQTTRERILEATLSLLKRAQGPISMGEIAKAARLSRQALYLIFSDKGDLFIELVRYVDMQRGLEQELAKIRDAPNGVAALSAMVDLQARRNPALKPLVDAIELLRWQDSAVQRAWDDRLENRLRGCRGIVDRIRADGRLRPELDATTATDLVWTLTSLRMWDDLVIKRGWSAEAYREGVTTLVLAAVCTPAVFRSTTAQSGT